MEESFIKIINYAGILPSLIYNLLILFILYLLSDSVVLYGSCKLLYEWNESIFFISPISLGKSLFLLTLSKKIDKLNEKCSVFLIFINYIISWILSVVFIIGFSELYNEEHKEEKCKKLQSFDLFYIIIEGIQVIIITLFGFYIFYSFVKKRILSFQGQRNIVKLDVENNSNNTVI
jgi:hypothetical protein